MKTETTVNDFSRLEKNLSGLKEDTNLFQFIKYINNLIENPDELFLTDYAPIIAKERTGEYTKPFLSVITRTQGKRPEMLRETILSLVAQTDSDFELILIGHKLNEDQRALVTQILSEQTEDFLKKVRFLELDHGNRTTPLNFGFSHAHGEYIAILDDDDIVFDNWVESFHTAAKETPGRVLHAYAIGQNWEVVNTDSGIFALRACGSPSELYCQDFEMIRELESNVCPPVGLAFPSFTFHEWGIIFDETLDTAEDWDFLMRTAFITGVTNITEPTCIYRLWTNAENSQTLHSQELWKKNHASIQEKFKAVPVILPENEKKVHVIHIVVQAPAVPQALRPQIKDRLRTKVPRPFWWFFKKIYRMFGGKKWLG